MNSIVRNDDRASKCRRTVEKRRREEDLGQWIHILPDATDDYRQ